MYDLIKEHKPYKTNSNVGRLEKKLPFEGESKLELGVKEISDQYRGKHNTEIDKAGVICVFYICKLPFVKC